jgi:hypothetical protein
MRRRWNPLDLREPRPRQAQSGGGDSSMLLALAAAAGVGAYFWFKKKPSQLATLAGTVLSGVDAAIIPGAIITVGTKQATSALVTGKFTIPDLPVGTATVDIIATGFLAGQFQVPLVAGSNPKVFQLFKTTTQAGLSGVVTNRNTGGLLQGVTVSVAGQSKLTGSDGSYSFTDLTAGTTVTVDFILSGYKTVTLTKALIAGANTLSTSMNNLGTINGYVTNTLGTIRIVGASIISGTYSTTTDPQGWYTLTLPSGDKAITCIADGYDNKTQTVTVDPEVTKNFPFTMGGSMTQVITTR